MSSWNDCVFSDLCSPCSSGCWTATPSSPPSQRSASGMTAAPRFTVHRSEPPEPWNSSTSPAQMQTPHKESESSFFCVLQSVILHCSVNGRNCFGKLNSLFQMLPGTLMPFQMSTFICCSPCLIKQSSTPKPSSPIINWIKVSPFITHPPLFHLSHAASRHKDRTQKSIVSSFFTEPTSWLTEWLETKQRSF